MFETVILVVLILAIIFGLIKIIKKTDNVNFSRYTKLHFPLCFFGLLLIGWSVLTRSHDSLYWPFIIALTVVLLYQFVDLYRYIQYLKQKI